MCKNHMPQIGPERLQHTNKCGSRHLTKPPYPCASHSMGGIGAASVAGPDSVAITVANAAPTLVLDCQMLARVCGYQEENCNSTLAWGTVNSGTTHNRTTGLAVMVSISGSMDSPYSMMITLQCSNPKHAVLRVQGHAKVLDKITSCNLIPCQKKPLHSACIQSYACNAHTVQHHSRIVEINIRNTFVSLASERLTLHKCNNILCKQ